MFLYVDILFLLLQIFNSIQLTPRMPLRQSGGQHSGDADRELQGVEDIPKMLKQQFQSVVIWSGPSMQQKGGHIASHCTSTVAL